MATPDPQSPVPPSSPPPQPFLQSIFPFTFRPGAGPGGIGIGSADHPTMLALLYHEIVRGDVLLRAPGLAYSTLASLIPILAIVLAVLSMPTFKQHQEMVFDALAAKLVIVDSADDSWLPT